MNKKARQTSEDPQEKKKQDLEDCFSQFPDDILVNIISFLPLKQAARTSILSTRWRYLWTFTAALNFDWRRKSFYPSKEEKAEYIMWVNEVLELHKGSDLNEFRIHFKLDVSHKSDITSWIYIALAKRVQNFELDLCNGTYYYEYTFPLDLYNTLKSGAGLASVKCLRSLRLDGVNVTGEILEFFVHYCPLLDQLYVAHSRSLLSLNVVGSSIQLKHLEIRLCISIKELEISAPSLLCFKYDGPEINLHIGDVPQLVDVSIHESDNAKKMCFIGPILSCFAQLKTLELDSPNQIFKLLSQCELPKLMHLKLRVTTPNQESLLGLSSIMKACPVLQKLTLELSRNGHRIGKKRHQVPGRSHQHLKLVELHGFLGREIDLALAFYLFENATKLEKMIIEPSKYSRKKAVKDFTDMLEAKLPQGVVLVVGS